MHRGKALAVEHRRELAFAHPELLGEVALGHVALGQVDPNARFDGSFLSHSRTLRPAEDACQGHSYARPKIFSGKYWAVPVKPQNSAELLRNRVEAAVADRGRRRALMRAMGLRSQGTITQWLNGEHNPSVDKLDSIAKFLGCTVSELFLPVTTSVLDQNPPASVNLAPTVQPGDVEHVALTRLLRESPDTIQQDDALRDTIIQIAHQLIALAARPKKTRSTARKKTRHSGRH